MNKLKCDQCAAAFPVHPPGYSGGTGYATTRDGRTICYACCGLNDATSMRRGETIILYLVRENDQYKVTNWPGTLQFSARVRKGRHNIARHQYAVQFHDADGRAWYGRQYGDFQQCFTARPYAVKGGA